MDCVVSLNAIVHYVFIVLPVSVFTVTNATRTTWLHVKISTKLKQCVTRNDGTQSNPTALNTSVPQFTSVKRVRQITCASIVNIIITLTIE